MVDTDYTFVLTEVGRRSAARRHHGSAATANGCPDRRVACGGRLAGHGPLPRRSRRRHRRSDAARHLQRPRTNRTSHATGRRLRALVDRGRQSRDVLLASATITLNAATTSTFVVVPETGSGTSATQRVDAAKRVGGLLRPQRHARAARYQRRHGSAAARRRNQRCVLAAVVLGDTVCRAYGLCAGSLGAYTLNVTPVGNPGVLELETQIAPLPRNA